MRGPRAASSSSISPSPPSDGGEGWGEEVRFYWFPLSSVLSPLVPRGERMESLMQPCARPGFVLFQLDSTCRRRHKGASDGWSLGIGAGGSLGIARGTGCEFAGRLAWVFAGAGHYEHRGGTNLGHLLAQHR